MAGKMSCLRGGGGGVIRDGLNRGVLIRELTLSLIYDFSTPLPVNVISASSLLDPTPPLIDEVINDRPPKI